MIKLFTRIFLPILFIGSVNAQLDTTWVKQYDRISSGEAVNIVDLPNGNYLLERGETYYEIGSNGDSITSGSFNYFSDINKMVNIDDTIYIGAMSQDGPVIAKLDANYDTLWTVSFANSNFGVGVSAILEDGGDIYVSGSYSSSRLFIGKVDKAGNKLWDTGLPQNIFSGLTSLIKLSDGNFIASGNVDDYPIAFKFDSAGDTLWHYTEFLFISFTEAEAFEKSNGNIVIVATNTFIELDPNGNKVSDSTAYNSYYGLEEVGDSIYLFGQNKQQQWSAPYYPYALMVNKNLDSLSSFIDSSFIDPSVGNSFTDVIQPEPGIFVAAGLIRDSINIAGNTWNVYLVKFNGVGNPVYIKAQGIKISESNVFPNPAVDIINFDHPIQSLTIFNASGKLIRKVRLNGSMNFNVQNLNSGTYFYELETIEGHRSKGTFIKK
jgi:hypothetical protein